MKSKFILITCCLIVIGGCNLKQSGSLKIGVMFSNLNELRFQKENAIMEEFVKKNNGEYILKNADNNPLTQEIQFEELLQQGIQVVIISVVNSSVGKSIIEKANNNGITTIMYDGFIGSQHLDYCIRFSDKEVGKLMAAYALHKIPTGNYMILGGDGRNENAPLIKNGIWEILQPNIATSNIKIAFNAYMEEWSSKEVYMQVKEFYNLSNYEPIDVIILSSDNMATGAIKALEEVKPSKWPLITGQDGSITACKLMLQGKQAMSVLKDSKRIAEQAAKMAMDCAQGIKPELNGATPANDKGILLEIPTFFIELEVVDSTRIPELIKRGIYTKESLSI